MKTGMPKAAITGIGTYVPEKVLTNADLEKMVDTSDEWIRTRTGIGERHVLDESLSTSDMAVAAAHKALQMADCQPQDLELIIVATVTGDYVFPSTACVVQDRLGATHSAAFDICSSCSGFIAALSTGSQFVRTGQYRKVLVIGADTITRLVDWQDRNVCVIFGDAASAVVLEPSRNDRGVLSCYLRSDGSGVKYLFQPAGGAKLPPSHDTVASRQHYIKMDGRETFKTAAKAMCEAAHEATRMAGMTPKEIDLVIPHQANIRIIQAAVQRLGIPMEQVAINIDRYGNTVAASIGLAMNEALAAGRLVDGSRVLLVGFGAGLTWGGIVLRWGH
ncbi:MAG: ketoacyl-ACP synthase III [Candidatus Riflebacteria bacterium]|nr:ketoacyl-ACP synthase III [Candidatus Riflebacteria bacterium]